MVRRTATMIFALVATSLVTAADAAAFEQDQRVNSLTLQFGTDAYATANAFGGAFVSTTTRSQLQAAINASVADGSTSWILRMPGLTDLSGTNSSPFDVGVVNGTPVAPGSGNPASYDGTHDLDWWYSTSGPPPQQLVASFTAGTFDAGPGAVALELGLFGTPSTMAMSNTRVHAVSGASSAPLKSTNGFPPGHQPSENLSDSLSSFETMGTGQLAGNISARSLENTSIPVSLTGGAPSGCSQAYTTANTMLDAVIGGCTIFMIQQIRPTQPDKSTVSGQSYTFTTNGTTKRVTGCTDQNGSTVPLDTCLDAAAYSSYFQFTTDRVIVLPVTPETLPDTTITSGPGEGSTITDPTPTFAFTSTVADSSFQCSVDGGAFGTCSDGSSHTATALSAGSHAFAVRARDTAGHVDPSPASRAFTVAAEAVGAGGAGGVTETDPPGTGDGGATDTDPTQTGVDGQPPETTISKRPADKTGKHKVKYSFGSSEPGSTFECKLDKGPFKPCGSPGKFKVQAGKHTFQVAATDAAGNRDPTPAKDRFKVLG